MVLESFGVVLSWGPERVSNDQRRTDDRTRRRLSIAERRRFWPRVMQVGLIRQDSGFPTSIQQSIAWRISRAPAFWRYAASAVGPAAICWSAAFSFMRAEK